MEEDEDLGELYKIVIQGSGVDVASEVLYFNKKDSLLEVRKSKKPMMLVLIMLVLMMGNFLNKYRECYFNLYVKISSSN